MLAERLSGASVNRQPSSFAEAYRLVGNRIQQRNCPDNRAT
jgi:hypothetical protein